jgi:hypothetical protein
MRVKFKSDSHQYFSEDDREMISVSSFVKRFEKDKDWREIAKKKANNLKKYQGIIKSVDDILKEWEDKRIKSTEAGTILHAEKEKELLGYEKIKVGEVDSQYKWSIPITELENGYVYPELMIYDFDYMICGQSDKVVIENNTINIYDYKTDKSIDFKGYSSEWKEADRLLPPVSHLEECNGNIYSLKMSLYMYLLWKANGGRLKSGKIILEWCPIERDEDGYPILYDGKPKQLFQKSIEMPYRKKEVISMLKTIK